MTFNTISTTKLSPSRNEKGDGVPLGQLFLIPKIQITIKLTLFNIGETHQYLHFIAYKTYTIATVSKAA